jgi:hypothetical protein
MSVVRKLSFNNHQVNNEALKGTSLFQMIEFK